MLRTGLAFLTCSFLLQLVTNSWALGCDLGPPPERWTQASGNGAYELIVAPIWEPQPEGGRLLRGATYRLERVGASRATVWQGTSPDLHSQAWVAGDGDYVVTASGRFDGVGITIRNSAGAVIRSLAEDDLVSIRERLDGAIWRIAGLDDTEELLLLEVDFLGESFENRRTISRRIQLMDGFVIDAPASPRDFEIPRLECTDPDGVEVFAFWRKLQLACNTGAGGVWAERTYRLEDGQFRLVEAFDFGPQGTLRSWNAASSESEPGPCETIYRDGDIVSERCGSDVTSSP